MSVVGSRLAAAQLLGRRERQEDEFGMVDLGAGGADRLVLTVADGMGGHAGGAEAAQCATKKFLAMIGQGGDPREALLPALNGANAAIAELVRADHALEGAGCTFVAAVIDEAGLSWISVGDSSLLLYRNGVVKRLNEDHSMRPVLADLVKEGRLSAADADRHHNRNALRSAVTGDTLSLIDQPGRVMPLYPGDQIVLASDGLDTLDHVAVARLLEDHAGAPVRGAVDAVLAAIADVGLPRQDNATVVLYRVAAAGGRRAPPPRRKSYRVLGIVIAFVVALALIAGAAVTLKPSLLPSWPIAAHKVGPEKK